jgi:hypothetical protein
MVAVKIIEYMQEQGQRGPLEGLLSEQVQHPNVVSCSSSFCVFLGGGVPGRGAGLPPAGTHNSAKLS